MAIEAFKPYQELSPYKQWCVDQVLQLSREIPVLARAIFEKLIEAANADEGSIGAVSVKELLRNYDLLLFKKISGICGEIFPAHFDKTSLTPYRKSVQIDRDFIAFFESIQGDNYYESEDESAFVLPARADGASISAYAQSVREWIEATPERVQKVRAITIGSGDFKSIPSEIRYLTNLTLLDIDNTPIRELPLELASLKQLEVLRIQHSAISVRPSVIDQLSWLQELVLENNPFTMNALH